MAERQSDVWFFLKCRKVRIIYVAHISTSRYKDLITWCVSKMCLIIATVINCPKTYKYLDAVRRMTNKTLKWYTIIPKIFLNVLQRYLS